MTEKSISRREFNLGLTALTLSRGLTASAGALGTGERPLQADVLAFIAKHRKPTGGYGWLSRINGHITSTFAAVGSYRLLGVTIPDQESLAMFVRSAYPVPDGLSQQPLWRIDYEQAQTLLWLGKSFDTAKLAMWQKPFVYNTYFEQNAYPTLQHQAMAVRLRKLAGDSNEESAALWESYFKSRMRPNGTFNNTGATDGSDGHLVNTLWSIGALHDLDRPVDISQLAIEWIKKCQLPSGGFTWSPSPALGGVENMIYTWAAVSLLSQAGADLERKASCENWVKEQLTVDGGFRSCQNALPSLTATYYALDALRMLGATASFSRRRPTSTVNAKPLPEGLKIYSAQIEAPGNGSPVEAVSLAEKLKIHLWTAKNSPDGWIAEAQKHAEARGLDIQFARGDEEYGTYTSLPGLGTYSHLDDLVAPRTAELSSYPLRKNRALPWTTFRDTRIRAIRDLHGRMVWQFNENEELSRILLDEACSSGDYAAISSFHFGLDDFLEYEPFLMDWEARLAMVGLQDAHGGESWWWASQLEGFRTLYLAKDPLWESFVHAMDRNWMLSVRRDASTGYQIQWSGASPEIRRFIESREPEWSWWGENAPKPPLAMLTVLTPGMPFEAGVPADGLCIRVRLRFGLGANPNKAILEKQESSLVSMQIDGRQVVPESIVLEHDRYLIYRVRDPSVKKVTVVVKNLATQETETLRADLSPSARRRK
jgi:prenyltransferase beta subunit